MSECVKEIESNQGVIRGVLHSPESDPIGTAFILHGYFSSNHIGPSRLYVLLSRILADNGYYVCRFDCIGAGDSDGHFEQITYKSEVDDYIRITEFAKKEGMPEPFILVGHSMGTSIAVILASKIKAVKGLILLSPSFGKMTWFNNLFTPKQITELKKKGRTERKCHNVKSDVINGFQSEEIFKICNKVDAKVIIIYGDKDEYYNRENVAKVQESIADSELLIIAGGDHNFLHEGCRNRLLRAFNKSIKK